MKHRLVITLLLLASTKLFAQEITLKECWDWAKEYYPKAKDRQVLLENSNMRIDNLQAMWYPKLNLNGQATWQNDVTWFPNPAIKAGTPPNNDQYKATIDINQTLYDGGLTSARKKIEKTNSATEMITLDIELYNIQKNVSDIFILNQILEAQENQIRLNMENIKARIKEMESAVEAGSILKSELNVLNVELLKLEQKSFDITEGKSSTIRTLALLTGKPLNPDSTKLTILETNLLNNENKRLEFQLFEQQKQTLELQSKLTSKNRMPQLTAFAQGGYGNPGLNMLKVSFEPIVYVGVKLSWNIWDWNQTSRQKRISLSSRQLIDDQKALFEQTQNTNIERSKSQITKLEKSLSLDDEIVKLRKEVTVSSKSKLQNGTLRASDYIDDLNKESLAELEQKIRQIQLDQARIELMQILGQN